MIVDVVSAGQYRGLFVDCYYDKNIISGEGLSYARAWRKAMVNPFNTLFGRLALLAIGLIVLVHGTTQILVMRELGQIDAEHSRRAVQLAVYARNHSEAPSARIVSTLGIHYVAADDVLKAGCPAPCTETRSPFDEELLAKLPHGSQVVSDPRSGTVWVKYGDLPYWLCMTNTLLPAVWFASGYALTFLLAVIVALIGAWQLQKPLRRLAEAARRFRLNHAVEPLPEKGPTEIKALIADFNEMTSALVRAEEERRLMLAGVAHDLKAPITRMMVRAELLEDAARGNGFQRDAAALLRIVNQFLDYAREEGEVAEAVSVDAHCREVYAEGTSDGLAIRLGLSAGERFCLPGVDMERIFSNLLGNVKSYGTGPVEITTRCDGADFVLAVRDHGPGIPADKTERALQPFVRLDPESGGDAHCGLGLSIVRKLAQANGGHIVCDNAVDGGFVVSLRFPAGPTSAGTDAGNCG